MIARLRSFWSHRTLPVLALTVFASACNEDGADVEITEAFIGNWVATSFIVDGEELITAEGTFSVSFGFFADGSYQLIVGGDTMRLLCDLADSCVDDGDFTHSGNVITLDPGTVDQLGLQFSVSGNTLNVSGTLDGSPFSAVFERT